MAKKIAAVIGGVLLGIVIAFARAGAFPFWGSSSSAAGNQAASAASPAATVPRDISDAKNSGGNSAPTPPTWQQ